MDGWADSIALCVWVAEQCVGRGRAGRERRQDWDGVDEFFRDAPPLEIEARRVLGVLALCAACVCVGAKAQTRRVGGVLGVASNRNYHVFNIFQIVQHHERIV